MTRFNQFNQPVDEALDMNCVEAQKSPDLCSLPIVFLETPRKMSKQSTRK